MGIETWFLFATLWLGLAAFPGPNAAYAMSVSSIRGHGAALAAAVGFALGVAVYVVLVGLGLIAFLAASSTLFEALRWVGVAYLGYLAWQAWTAPTTVGEPARPTVAEGGKIILRAAAITLTNPKSAISYVLIYPPFMTQSADTLAGAVELSILGITSVVLSFFVYAAYGLGAARFSRWIRTPRQALIRNRFFALLFAGAGVLLATAARR